MKSKIILLSLVVSILCLGCKNVPTFEKDGGVRIVLKLSYSDFLKAAIVEGNDEQLQQVLTEIKEDQVKDFDEFINSYRKVEEKNFPEIRFATIFMKLEWSEKINFNSTNEDVVKVLKQEWEKLFLSTNNIIIKRLANIEGAGIASVETDNGNHFIVKVPGIKDTKRIESILSTIGELGFWETYNNTEIFTYLNQINGYLVKKNYKSNAPDNSIKEELKNGSLETSSSLISLLEKQNKKEADSLVSMYPLFSLLTPLTSGDGQLISGSVIGSVQIKDTAELSRLFLLDSVSYFLPLHCRLVFSKPIQQQDQTYCEVIALKGNRANGPMIDGSVITSASVLPNENRNEIFMQMSSEGTRTWRRMTSDNIGRQIAITLDGIVYVHPVVQSQIEGGKSNITGNFTLDEATDLAFVLNSGKYPLKLNVLKTEVVEVRK
ncbi:MAG: hypothetical protein A3F72_13120 [Bacteroidetes bacterium RIFCSPLOWO2_12_FULL_35_15]|nr:MAG: hypothetical protein A3F72_13120 [Bacteroidetes bacterium RIFCSPLOWO2_12_FULL_35_15]